MTDSHDRSLEDALRPLADDELPTRLGEARFLEPGLRSLVALSALLALNRIDEFEEQMLRDLDDGLPASDIIELLVELAELGVRVPPRVYALARARMA